MRRIAWHVTDTTHGFTSQNLHAKPCTLTCQKNRWPESFLHSECIDLSGRELRSSCKSCKYYLTCFTSFLRMGLNELGLSLQLLLQPLVLTCIFINRLLMLTRSHLQTHADSPHTWHYWHNRPLMCMSLKSLEINTWHPILQDAKWKDKFKPKRRPLSARWLAAKQWCHF